jgi:predicted permease
LHIDPAVAIAPGAGPNLDVFGRLAPGATQETAQAELATITRRLSTEGPAALASMESRIVPYSDIFVHAEAEGETSAYAILRFLIAIFLVIVAMNVAVLVYARTVTRTGEIAVRTALGATRSRIVMQLFAEAFVLSGVAALAGLAVVAVGLRMFDAALAGFFEGRPPFWMHSGLSAGTVLHTLALAVLAAVIIGVFPAMRATGARLRAAMGSIGSGAKARLGATWTLLIVVQVAVSVAILPLALLKVVEMTQLAMRPAGFASGEYLSTRFLVEADGGGREKSSDAAVDSTRRVVNTLLSQLAAEPGVAGATITISSPWNGGGNAVIETDDPKAEATTASVQNVDTNFIHLFDVRMLAGRPFNAGDAALRLRNRPVIVNRSFVDKMLGAGDPLGRRIRYRAYDNDVQPWMRIVGVIEDFPKAVRTPGGQVTRGAAMYHLAVPGDIYDGLLTIRLRGRTPEDFTPTLRRIAMHADPALQLSDTRSLDSMYQEDTRAAKQLAAVVILVTLSVVLLSAAGIHAMMSFAVNQRRREIGIRSALGAPARLLLTSILARASRQLTLGVAIGLAAAMAADTMSGGMLLSGTQLLLVPATALFMLLVGILAAAGPARRGLRVQPTEALQAD